VVVTFGITCGISPGKGAYGSDVRQSRPGTRRFRRRLRRRTARVKASLAGRTGVGRLRLGTAGSSPWLRRGVLAAALLVVAFVPYPQQGVPSLAASVGCRAFCHQAQQQDMLKWAITPLPGSWDVDSGPAGTVPASGQAYAAVGDGVVAVGIDMTVYAYRIRDHAALWSVPLTGFPAGAAIVSVRTWPDEVTAGVSYPGKDGVMARTEVVISDGPDGSGVQENEFPAAMFGGAVGGSATYTVVVGPTAVTSYDNATGRVRWQYLTGLAQTWQSDGLYLYVTEAAGGVRSINTATGAERELVATTASTVAGITPTATATFAGTLSEAFDNVLLFSGAGGVTAYSASTGVRLWFLPGTVPDGADPVQDKLYLTRESSLLEVDPLTGRVQASAPGLGTGMYVVRDGVALGFDQESDGANGAAWGYDISTQHVVLSASPLGWPHFFIDLSGLGGGAAPDGDLVVVAACAQVGPAVQPAPTASPSPSTSDSLPLGPSPSASGSALFSVPPSPSLSPSPSPSASPGTDSPSPSPSTSLSPSISPSASTSSSPTPSPSPSTSPALTCQRPELVALGL
jgi:hypothetical protein